MAEKKKTTALAVADSFQIANLYDNMDPDLMEELQDQMDDLDNDSGITCRKIKIPSGGGLAYEVQGEDDDDVEYMKEIKGVIVFTHRANGFWPGSYGDDDQNKVPACSSMDGKTGFWPETGEIRNCETCPMNQFGSASDQKGNQARGKACKNMRRIYLMMDGDPNFYLLTVPPTSTKDVNKQLQKIIAGGTPYTGLIVSLKLEKAQNSTGVAYSKVVVTKSGLLPPAVATIAKEMRRQIKDQYRNTTLTLDDYAAAPAKDSAAAVQDPEVADAEFAEVTGNEDLPFKD
jgi:hypothetical protein